MRFIVDECTGPAVARWLRSQSHDVHSVYESDRGSSDAEVLSRANSENRVLISNDKGFGERIFRERHPHQGVILLRLVDERVPAKIDALKRVIDQYGEKLSGAYVVVTESQVRFGHD